ncbi:Glycosyltransferase, GT2 family [Dyadobacter soli]|uniref:Glycosyltransferase, GT2 family n=1 Tax=Dyadobacter soli TaxID=659014 RepID=A0A1G7D1E9_9BACT|nr:glycosyltransferase [Dyadobacter soli]SDE45422.1 Glycosyltransferase, GT2 family [Dyadobacter soli]
MILPVNISVVIPTYKRPALLRKCLDALREQTYWRTFYEVIVVSDGPDRETEVLIERFIREQPDCAVFFHHLPAKKGPAAARNYGWKKSTGELVVFTDDDCIPDPCWLEEYAARYQAMAERFVAFTGRVIVPISPKPTDYEKNVAHLATAEFITANCTCSRAALEMTGGFDEDFPIAWREDSDLEFKLLELKIPIVHVPQAAVCHPVREADWGVSIAEQRKSMFNALLFKKHPQFYRAKISSGPVWTYYIIILATLAAIAALVAGMQGVAAAALAVWALAVGAFVIRRLKGTSDSLSHRLEMIFTSLVIPYLSVYWTLRGALRYKVFFL